MSGILFFIFASCEPFTRACTRMHTVHTSLHVNTVCTCNFPTAMTVALPCHVYIQYSVFIPTWVTETLIGILFGGGGGGMGGGAKSLFPISSWREMLFFPLEISILIDPTQINVVSKSGKQKKKKNPLLWSFSYLFTFQLTFLLLPFY